MYHIRSYHWMGLLVMMMVVFVVALPAQARPVGQGAPARIDASAATWLAQATPAMTATFIVELRDDGSQAQADQARNIPDKLARRARVYQILSERANRNERALRAFLREQGREGDVSAVQSFVAFNGFALTTDQATIDALQQWDQVSSIRLNAAVPIDQPTAGTPLARINSVEWNINKIGADRVQNELGINGSGVLVGSLDTGARYTHEILRTNYKCASSSNHSACWFDAVNGQTTPYDDDGHGSHTLGSAVGSGGYGVAPGARWIACKAFVPFFGATYAAIHACFTWFLHPGGSTANAPDVIVNSWNDGNSSSTEFQMDVNNLINAGIFPMFANGNIGPSCGTVLPPASYANAIGVGATDSNDNIAGFSARGRSPLTNAIKPDLSAPGVSIRSAASSSDTSYQVLNGTSMATPHVAGLATLLLDVDPNLTVAQLTSIMKNNALQRHTTECTTGSDYPNNVYGWGRIRAYEAVRALTVLAGTYDDTAAAVAYSGSWTRSSSFPKAYASTLAWANVAGATARLTFTGSRITTRFTMAYNRGSATISIDGVSQGSLDSYAATTRWQADKTWTVPSGTHTIQVRTNGDGYADVDAFVVDVLTAGTGTYDDHSTQIRYIGTWTMGGPGGASGAYNQTLAWSKNTEDAATFTFSGSQVTWVYTKAPNRGIADLAIDEQVLPISVDLYAPTIQWQTPITISGLSAGIHTLHISISGRRNAAASDYYVDVDRFIVP